MDTYAYLAHLTEDVWLMILENTPLPFSGGFMAGRKWITPLPGLSSV